MLRGPPRPAPNCSCHTSTIAWSNIDSDADCSGMRSRPVPVPACSFPRAAEGPALLPTSPLPWPTTRPGPVWLRFGGQWPHGGSRKGGFGARPAAVGPCTRRASEPRPAVGNKAVPNWALFQVCHRQDRTRPSQPVLRGAVAAGAVLRLTRGPTNPTPSCASRVVSAASPQSCQMASGCQILITPSRRFILTL